MAALAVITALAAPTAAALDNAAPAGRAASAALSLERIVERNTEARGGAARWRQLRAIELVGRLDAGRARKDGGEVPSIDQSFNRAALRRGALASRAPALGSGPIIQLPFRLDLQRPGQQRLEIEFAGATAVQVYDGHQGWKLRPYLGRREVEPFSAEEADAAAQQQELDGPLVDYASKGTRVALEGMEIVEGHDCYRLQLTLKSGDVRRLWIDASTFLDLKIDGVPRRLDGRPHAVATWYRDYRDVSGLKIPFLLETRVDGVRDTQRVQVQTVALNPNLSPGAFSKPE
jgi:hypothetical protein